MAKLIGKGAPTRKTTGAMGDIYTDSKTGRQYQCVFAYRNGTENMFDCQWVEIKSDKKSQPVVEEVIEPVEEVVETVDNEPEQEVIQETATPKHIDYSAYSKKNK